MGSMFLSLLLSVVINTTPIIDQQPTYVNIGECRITEYCPTCNGGNYESASGKRLEYGDCACSWLPMGTVINIEGEEFTVVDICGTDAIDIFVDTDTCQCNLNEYRNVSIKQWQ